MIKLCADYLRIILFCGGLLIGIQIPAVVDQYAKRIDASNGHSKNYLCESK